MFEYCLKCTGINNMHEQVAHTQHVQHQFPCIGVTLAQRFSLDYMYFLFELLWYMFCI